MTSENNKRIAKNTLLLYFRMLLTMGVSLYTVRVVLETLGVIDYGLYNVIGGVVVMFSFLSGTMASASQRFFAFELGRGDSLQLRRTFCMTLQIYFLIGLIILILAETIGLWFLNTQMAIPEERMEAAHWVYQFSIFSFMVTMFATPYNAIIIAYERMDVYAWVSIVEVILKLLIVYLLVLFDYDKLKLYGALMFLVTVFIALLYSIYSKYKFKECRYSLYWETSLFKQIVSYSGWNLFGSLSAIMKTQGVNILLNIFFGPVVNAARGIAYQISSALNGFIANFSQAVNPQIIKYYASNQKENMFRLVLMSSKFSYLLFLALVAPVLFETQFIMSLWLKNIPEDTILFTRLVALNVLVDSLASPLITSALATGKIRNYQVIVGGLLLMSLPVTYIFLKWGYPPESSMYIMIVISIFALLSRLILLSRMMKFPVKQYVKSVFYPVLIITILYSFIPTILNYQLNEGWIRFLLNFVLGLPSYLLFVYLFALNTVERNFVLQNIKQKILRR